MNSPRSLRLIIARFAPPGLLVRLSRAALPTASAMIVCSLNALAVEETGDAAFMHHRDPVADPDDLLHVAGDHQDGDAAVGQLAHQPVDLVLGADVDAARRLVEDQHAWAPSTATWPAPPSAGCRPTATPRRRRRPAADVEPATLRFGLRPLRGPDHQPVLSVGAEVRQGDVVLDRKAEQQAGALAILRHEKDAAVDGIARRCDRERLAVDADLAAAGGSSPKMVRASSVRPDPTSPASPRISPCRTARSTGCARDRYAVLRPISSSTPAGRRGRRPVECLQIAADHMPDHDVGLISLLASAATRRPSRRTMTRSARVRPRPGGAR